MTCDQDRRCGARLSGWARGVLLVLLLCTGWIWWLAAGPARADTPPSNNDRPTILGTAQQGEMLTASPGTWSGDDPISFSYQWSDGRQGSPQRCRRRMWANP